MAELGYNHNSNGNGDDDDDDHQHVKTFPELRETYVSFLREREVRIDPND